MIHPQTKASGRLPPPLAPVTDAPLSKDVDLSELFKSGPNETMGPGDFLELPDPTCTKSFSLQLTQPVSSG